MIIFFKGCFGFIFGVIVNMRDFCYKENFWYFIIKIKCNFKIILMFLVFIFVVVRSKYKYVCFCIIL